MDPHTTIGEIAYIKKAYGIKGNQPRETYPSILDTKSNEMKALEKRGYFTLDNNVYYPTVSGIRWIAGTLRLIR